MAKQSDYQVQLDRIAAAIAKLQANAGGMNLQEEDTTLTSLTSQADSLEQLANAAPTP